MSNIYSKAELRRIGFKSVGKDTRVSKDARLFAIHGELGDFVRIDAYAILTGRILLKDRVHISPFCFLGGTGGAIRMGSDSGLSIHVTLFTKSADYASEHLTESKKLTGNIVIGNRSIIGVGSTIMPGTSIGKDVSVGCNCVINHNIEDGSIIVNRGIGLVTLSKRNG